MDTTNMKPKNKKMNGCLIIVIVFIIICGINAIVIPALSLGDPFAKVQVKDDVTIYSRISKEELLKIKGNPESTEKWNQTTPNTKKTYNMTILTYSRGKEEFILSSEGKVVRYNKYLTEEYSKQDNVSKYLLTWGIKTRDSMTIVSNWNGMLRCQSVSDNVAEVWYVTDILKITYDLRYFD